MKRLLLYAAGFVFIALSLTACEKSCKVCHQVTTNDSTGAVEQTGSDTEYCGASLIAIEATKDQSIGGHTTKWVCN